MADEVQPQLVGVEQDASRLQRSRDRPLRLGVRLDEPSKLPQPLELIRWRSIPSRHPHTISTGTRAHSCGFRRLT
jgi:hypothetical protein